jgi:hypothetical protein
MWARVFREVALAAARASRALATPRYLIGLVTLVSAMALLSFGAAQAQIATTTQLISAPNPSVAGDAVGERDRAKRRVGGINAYLDLDRARQHSILSRVSRTPRSNVALTFPSPLAGGGGECAAPATRKRSEGCTSGRSA